MEDFQRERYRRLRNMWGWIIAIVWIAFWWIALSASGPTAGSCAGLADCGGKAITSAGSAVSFAFTMFFIVLASPIAFAISPHIARTIVEREGREVGRARAVKDAAEAARLEAERREREKAAQKLAGETRLKLVRDEFITRLGTASDALKLIPQADAQRKTQIMLVVSAELRSLVATYNQAETVEALNDEAVMLALASVLKSLKAQGPLQSEAQTLLEAVKRAAVAQGRRSA